MSGGRDVEGGGDSFESGLDGLDKVSSPDKGIEDNTCIEQNVDNFFGEINNIGEINKDSEFNTSTEHVDYSEENNIDEFIDGDIDEISNIENDRSDEISRFDDIDSNIENFVDGNDKYNDNMEFNIGFEDTLQSDLDNFIDGNDVEYLEVGDNNCDMPHEQGDTQEIVDKFINGDIDDINPIDKDLSENDESIYDNIEGFIDGDIENPEGGENKEIEGQGLEEGSYVEVDNDVGSAEVDDIDESDIDKDSEIEVDNDVDSAEVDEIDESDIGEDSEIEVDNNVDSAEVDDIDESDIDEDSEIEVDNDVDFAEVDEIDESDIDEDSEIEVDNDVDSAEAKDKYQLESEYNKSLQDMTKYMSEHNYGKEDYAEYSKDPEWQDLNEKMQDAKNAVEGADTENNIREIDIKYENTNSEYIEDNNKYFGKLEIDENVNKIFIKGSNYEEFKEAYNLGGGYEYRPYEKNKEENINADKIEGITVEKSDIDNPDIFWSQHEKNGTLESFKDIVRNIPDVVDQLGKGRTINELLQDEKLSSCTRIYFLDKVKVVKNGDYYEFDGDGRHRVLAAREAGYDIPVEIIGEKIKVGSQDFDGGNNSYDEEKNDSSIKESGRGKYSIMDNAKDYLLGKDSAYDVERFEKAGIKGAFDELPRHRREAVYELFENAPNEIKNIVNKLSNILSVENATGGLCCHYDIAENKIRMEGNMDDTEYAEVFSHEYGHFVDFEKNDVSNMYEFRDAISKDLEKYDRNTELGRNNFDKMLDNLMSSDAAFDRAISDNMSAYFKNDYEVVKRYSDEGIAYYQHDDSYWENYRNRPAEIYANLFSISAQCNKSSCEFMKQYFPNTWEQFEKTL